VQQLGKRLPSFQIAFARSSFQLITCLMLMKHANVLPLGPREHRFWLWARGVAGALSLLAYCNRAIRRFLSYPLRTHLLVF
jgi:hypothetical protein